MCKFCTELVSKKSVAVDKEWKKWTCWFQCQKEIHMTLCVCSYSDGTLYFNPVSELAIESLRSGSRHAQIVVKDSQTIQFSSDILVKEDDNYIWFISSKFQRFFRQTYDPNSINFRVMRIPRLLSRFNKPFIYY